MRGVAAANEVLECDVVALANDDREGDHRGNPVVGAGAVEVYLHQIGLFSNGHISRVAIAELCVGEVEGSDCGG